MILSLHYSKLSIIIFKTKVDRFFLSFSGTVSALTGFIAKELLI